MEWLNEDFSDTDRHVQEYNRMQSETKREANTNQEPKVTAVKKIIYSANSKTEKTVFNEQKLREQKENLMMNTWRR